MIAESNTIFRRFGGRASSPAGVMRKPAITATYVVCDDAELREELAAAEPALVVVSFDELPDALPQAASVQVFLPHPSPRADELLRRCLVTVERSVDARVCLFGTVRVHLGDRLAAEQESTWLRRFQAAALGRCVVLRTGTIVRHRNTKMRRLIAPLHPLFPRSWRSYYVSPADILAAARRLDTAPPPCRPTQTLLGVQRTVAEDYRRIPSSSLALRFVTAVATVAAWLGGRALLAGLAWLVRRFRGTSPQSFTGTLEPRSVSELLSLAASHNRSQIVLAGYNTGVVHFGWKFPGRTVVKTTGCCRCVRVRDTYVDVDAGITLKQLIGELARHGRELFAVPNYSYVTVGTAFCVPIHGSSHAVTTLGDTIEKVLAYDMRRDRFIVLRRGTAAFAATMYAPQSDLLVLRLRLRLRPQTRYFMQRNELAEPDATTVWNAFADAAATNIELRKPAASAAVVQVAKFYASAGDGADVLEVPRDSIGRLWDRLEECWLTSYLFHALTRRFAFHVELFLDRGEFETFWQAHRTLPLLKLQLRYARRDDMPHSPIGARLRRRRSLHASHRRLSLPFLYAGSLAPCSIQSRQTQHVSCRPQRGRRSIPATKSLQDDCRTCFGRT
ncbi:MAG: hypothetical protein QM775_11015 [Pirellulales bacterium]